MQTRICFNRYLCRLVLCIRAVPKKHNLLLTCTLRFSNQHTHISLCQLFQKNPNSLVLLSGSDNSSSQTLWQRQRRKRQWWRGRQHCARRQNAAVEAMTVDTPAMAALVWRREKTEAAGSCRSSGNGLRLLQWRGRQERQARRRRRDSADRTAEFAKPL